MKVNTLRESLDSCAKNDKKKKRKSRGEMIKSFFGKIEEEDVMNRTSRGSILRSTSTRNNRNRALGKSNSLHLDDNIAAAVAYDSKRLRFFDVEVREYSVTVSDISSSGTGLQVNSVCCIICVHMICAHDVFTFYILTYIIICIFIIATPIYE